MAGHQKSVMFANVRVEWCPELVEGPPTFMYYVYILCCSDDTFYVGSTRNLKDRVTAHNVGRGSTYTAKRRPVRLMYYEVFHTEVEAIQRERQLKGWSTAKKESLILGDLHKLKRLSKRRS